MVQRVMGDGRVPESARHGTALVRGFGLIDVRGAGCSVGEDALGVGRLHAAS